MTEQPQPGTDLDLLIERRLFHRDLTQVATASGEDPSMIRTQHPLMQRPDHVPCYSTDRACAHEVLRTLRQSHGVRATVEEGASVSVELRKNEKAIGFATAATLPLAVCLATLNALDRLETHHA